MADREDEMSEFVAGCSAGFESLVRDEIETMGGMGVSCDTGVVSWSGILETGYRCCLWSRYSSRVLMLLKSFPAGDPEELYESCRNFPWHEHLDLQKSFAVSCTLSADSAVSHSRYAALRVKDAIVDAFRDRTGSRPNVQIQNPDVPFHLHIKGREGRLFLDFSGESLHRRGYRVASGSAPLKESLAAAIVTLSGWPDEPGTLVDPMCGTGTLLLEAALMYGDSAPGLSRSYFGFFGWQGHDKKLWDRLVEEALERETQGAAKKWPLLIGYDSDPVVVSAARKNIKSAGLEEVIQVRQGEIAFLNAATRYGTVLSNLPYGERLSEKDTVMRLYSCFGRILRQRFAGWKCGVFISNPELTDSFGLRWQNKYRLYNGPISCSLLTGTVEQEGPPFVWNPVAKGEQKTDRAGEFANRLTKNLRKTLKWAEREKVDCFRVYDRDLPDYNLTVDLYTKWVHIQEYAAPKSIDPELARTRFEDAVRTVKDILGVRSDRVFVKRRERQRGKKQYEKKAGKKKMYEVKEGEASFLVNFTDYLDTGLFLDHRPLRQRLTREVKGKRFLNLFGYTGTATVQAAMGGAESTTTVDLSATYLNWARMNLALNGFAETRHQVERGDCEEWLKTSKQKYDVIFIDPPTFSNTKKEGRVFDVQRDHSRLLRLAMTRLESGGTLYFSTNFRRFTLDEELCRLYRVEDITKETIPHDFSRSPRIHYCWKFSH